MSTFISVRDGRGQKIRGLWKRGERFYAQITTTLQRGHAQLSAEAVKTVRRIPLAAATVAEARDELNKKRAERQNGGVLYQTRSATYQEAGARFLAHVRAVGHLSAKTIIGYETSHNRLVESFGTVPLSALTNAHINGHIERRRQTVSTGAVNIELSTIRSVIKYAVEVGILIAAPVLTIRNLNYTAGTKRLITAEQVALLAQTSIDKHPRAGKSMAELILFLAYSGARKDEANRVRWSDLDFARRTLRIVSGETNPEERLVEFNPKLEELLVSMRERREADNEQLWPWIDYKMIWAIIKESGLEEMFKGVAFHSFRHFFISNCVMAGVDYLTIAKWVGHKDGGVLIGQVYGHLNETHRKNSAAKVSFQ